MAGEVDSGARSQKGALQLGDRPSPRVVRMTVWELLER